MRSVVRVKSITPRSERPIRRWISELRPEEHARAAARSEEPLGRAAEITRGGSQGYPSQADT